MLKMDKKSQSLNNPWADFLPEPRSQNSKKSASLFRGLKLTDFPFIGNLFQVDDLVHCRRCGVYILIKSFQAHFDRWHNNSSTDDPIVNLLPFHSDELIDVEAPAAKLELLPPPSTPVPVSKIKSSSSNGNNKRMLKKSKSAILPQPPRHAEIVSKNGLKTVFKTSNVLPTLSNFNHSWTSSPQSDKGTNTSDPTDEDMLFIDSGEYDQEQQSASTSLSASSIIAEKRRRLEDEENFFTKATVSFDSIDSNLDPCTHCCCIDMGDLKCRNSILCTGHTLEEKRKVSRPHDIFKLMMDYRQRQQLIGSDHFNTRSWSDDDLMAMNKRVSTSQIQHSTTSKRASPIILQHHHQLMSRGSSSSSLFKSHAVASGTAAPVNLASNRINILKPNKAAISHHHGHSDGRSLTACFKTVKVFHSVKRDLPKNDQLAGTSAEMLMMEPHCRGGVPRRCRPSKVVTPRGILIGGTASGTCEDTLSARSLLASTSGSQYPIIRKVAATPAASVQQHHQAYTIPMGAGTPVSSAGNNMNILKPVYQMPARIAVATSQQPNLAQQAQRSLFFGSATASTPGHSILKSQTPKITAFTGGSSSSTGTLIRQSFGSRIEADEPRAPANQPSNIYTSPAVMGQTCSPSASSSLGMPVHHHHQQQQVNSQPGVFSWSTQPLTQNSLSSLSPPHVVLSGTGSYRMMKSSHNHNNHAHHPHHSHHQPQLFTATNCHSTMISPVAGHQQMFSQPPRLTGGANGAGVVAGKTPVNYGIVVDQNLRQN